MQPVSVITGGTDGIGRGVASQLVKAGHEVVILARNPEKAVIVCAELCSEGPGKAVAVPCDLASLASVRAAAATVSATYTKIDRLVGVAGVYGGARRETVDGHEAHLAVNYLAPYLLTRLLLPKLEATPGARVVHVTGETARMGCLRLGDLQRKRMYWALGAYAQSKLAQIFFVRTLAKELAGRGVSVHAVHPGPAATGHLASAPGWLRWAWSLLPGPAQAARNVARVVLDPRLEARSGDYFMGRWRAPAPWAAYDRRLAAELEASTRELVGWS